MTNWCNPKTNFAISKLVRPKTFAILPSATQSRTSSLPLEPSNQISSFQRGELSRYRERSNLRKDAIP